MIGDGDLFVRALLPRVLDNRARIRTDAEHRDRLRVSYYIESARARASATGEYNMTDRSLFTRIMIIIIILIIIRFERAPSLRVVTKRLFV